ncbi:MAG: glycosyltransferase family 4 protein [Burkholderiales bacterium]|nr:glycosyltransferase family 4 protein [Burkholderiales bacterium]
MQRAAGGRVAFVLKGWPRLSETFIAQEIAALERRGLAILIVALRRPTDARRHPVHDEVRAEVRYLPEYLSREPLRVLRAWRAVRRWPTYRAARARWLADLARDPTPNRVRRFGQALVLAAELPPDVERLHAHFLHTPASVARYGAILRGLAWSCSTHAKDVWTTPAWEKREKLADCAWAVACNAAAYEHLAALAPPGRVALVYHGLDLARFPPPPAARPPRDASDPRDPVRLLSVARLVEKKGTDVLLEALAQLPRDLHWRLEHIGGGPLAARLARRARRLGIADRIDWRGPRAQPEVLAAYRAADLFVLASRIAPGGDRDGLPNVLLEAASQRLACVATRVAGIPELLEDGVSGVLVPAEAPAALAEALASLMRDPLRRARLGAAARRRVETRFALAPNLERLAARFGLAGAQSEARVCASRSMRR